MPAQRPPTTEDLAAVRDQLRAEIREAREVLKDMRAEIKAARQEVQDARELVPMLTDELFSAEVKKQVARLGEATEQAMAQATARVFASFDRLHDTLMGQDAAARRSGKPPLPDLIATRGQRLGGE